MPRLIISLLPPWVGWATSVALVGWLIYAVSGSAALVSLAFGLRLLPLALGGVPTGALADRLGAVRVLALANVLSAAVSFGLAAALAAHAGGVGVLLLAALVYGVGDPARFVAAQSLAYGIGGPVNAGRAIALVNLISGLGQVGGGVLTGVMIGEVGPSGTAVAVGFIYLAGSMTLIRFPAPRRDEPGPRVRLVESVRGGLRLVRVNRAVRFLIVVALVAEILAFSAMALDPVFAAGVYKAGSHGLGEIVDARGVGRIGAAIILMLVGRGTAIARWLAASVLVFGVGLVGYAVLPLLVALWPVALAGAASLMVDSLTQTGLQASVDESLRGRVAGLWVVIVGLGPIGVAQIGLMASTLGARAALAINGAAVIAFGLLLLVISGRDQRLP